MGIRVTVGGRDYEVSDYSVQEQATPLAAGESMGSVGQFNFELPLPDPEIHPDDPLVKYGSAWLIDQDVELLSDSYYGFTLGKVVSANDSNGIAPITCLSRLGELNVYNVQAEPFIGTLGDAFDYYASLAGISVGVEVDDSVADREVIFPGFSGELWYNLKQLAAAQDCDISLVSGVILLRPIRARVAERGNYLQKSMSTGGGTLAQSVEVYHYKSEEITDELVYPVGGWTPETEVLNVNAGETTEYTLELSASLSSIEQPTMETFVGQDDDDASVYTVVTDDGLPVDPELWDDFGGRVEVTLNPDTRTLAVMLTGATGVPLATGGTATSFSLALASDETGSRYSTLRIVGTGVAFLKEKKTISTGVSASRTATEVGVTIDNPFFTDLDTVYSAGSRAARQFAGPVPTLTGSVTSVNQRGETGKAEVVSYGFVESEFSGQTYSEVQTTVYNFAPVGGKDYRDMQEHWAAQSSGAFSNQTYGNVAGARIWDQNSRRWYRIRSASTSPEGIQIAIADDDLTHGDMKDFCDKNSFTYADIEAYRSELNYQQEGLVGLRVD